MSLRPRQSCVDCGAAKPPGAYIMKQRCDPCRAAYKGAQGAAGRAVAQAKWFGNLGNASDHKCVDCGDQAEHWDHRDYSKPLQVDPVCRTCNFRRGPALYRKPDTATQAALT